MSEEKAGRSPVGLSQKSRIGFLFKDSAVYGGAAAISKAFSLITFPLLARHFSTEDYGVIDFFGVLVNFLAILVVFGQDSAVARYFYEYEDRNQRRELISQSLFLQVAVIVVLVPLLWAATPVIGNLLVDGSNIHELFRLILVQIPFVVLVSFSQNLLKWSFCRKQFLIISLGSVSLSVFLIVLGVYWLNINVAGLLIIGLITQSVFGLLGLWFIRNWLVLPRNLIFLKELLPYAFPLGLVCAAGAFVPAVERWLTSELLGSKELGLYAAGTRVAMLVALFVGAFQTAWGPFYLSLHKQNNAIETYNWVLKVISLSLILIVFALSSLAYPLILVLATDRYAAGAIVIFPLSMGLAVQAVSWITEIGISISKRSHLNIYAYIAYIAGTVGGIYVMAPRLGLLGVGLGILFGHISKAVTSSWLGHMAHPMPWSFKPVIFLFFTAAVVGALCLWGVVRFGPEFGVVAFGVGFLLLGLVGIFMLFDSGERLIAFDALKTRLNSGGD